MSPPAKTPGDSRPATSGVSVIICCHNSAARLPETLRHFLAQEVPDALPWEIIVVDNASSDETRATAESFAASLAPGQLRIVEEPEPGLSHARLCGAENARYEFLSFVDDDNWVAPDWVATTFDFFASHPEAGAVGGMGEPVIEQEPAPPWLQKFAGAYAAAPQYAASGDITDTDTSLLWGAGLGVRRSIFHRLRAAGFAFLSTDRKGGNLSSGGDTELCLAIRALGWRLHYTSQLRYRHFLTPQRLNWDYLRRLFRGAGQSAVYSHIVRRATDRKMPAGRRALERMWIFQMLYTLRSLGRIALSCPRAFRPPAEGLLERLQVDALLGSLQTLLRLRGEYRSLFDVQCQRYAIAQDDPSSSVAKRSLTSFHEP